MKKLNLIAALALLFLLGACGSAPKEKPANSSTASNAAPGTEAVSPVQNNEPVYEIAIGMAKPNMEAAFDSTRAHFVSVLTGLENVSHHRVFQSVASLSGQYPNPVFIDMAQHANPSTLKSAQKAALKAKQALASTVGLAANVFVQPAPDSNFDLSTLAKEPGQVLALGILRVNQGQEKAFVDNRKAFVAKLNGLEGVLESYAFKVVSGQDIENMAVNITVYANEEAFKRAAETMMKEQVTAQYFGTITPVTSQYAYSVK